MKIVVRENKTVWEEEVISIEDIERELESNPKNSQKCSFEIFDNDGVLITSGIWIHYCEESKDSEFWFDIEEEKYDKLQDIETYL